MKRIENFEPKNNPKISSVKESFSIIKEQKKCVGILCDECPFKNKQIEKKTEVRSPCLINILFIENRKGESSYIYDLAINYYKYFYISNIAQETFDI